MGRNEFIITLVLLFVVLPAIILGKEFVEQGLTIQTLTLSFAAFFLGTLFEFRKISQSWKKTFLTLGGALLASLVAFVASEDENPYILQDHLNLWPLCFVGGFLLIFVCSYTREITPKLGEGITTLHSMTLLYFLGELYDSGFLGWGWVAICAVVSFYVFMHALTYIEISRSDRLWLSLWSAFTMAIFAVLYVKNVLQMSTIEGLVHQKDYVNAAYVFLEYFLLGVSGAYIAQNLFMLLGYLPDKHNFFNAAYFRNVRELNESHIERYSADQIDKIEALFVILIVGGLLAANFVTKKLEPAFAIWICMAVTPVLISIASYGFGNRHRRG